MRGNRKKDAGRTWPTTASGSMKTQMARRNRRRWGLSAHEPSISLTDAARLLLAGGTKGYRAKLVSLEWFGYTACQSPDRVSGLSKPVKSPILRLFPPILPGDPHFLESC